MFITRKIILLCICCIILLSYRANLVLAEGSDQKTIKFKFITPPPSATPAPTDTPTPTLIPSLVPSPTIYLSPTPQVTPTPKLSTQCGYKIARAAKTIVNSWPVGTQWNGLTMCTASCTDPYGYKIPFIECTQTPGDGSGIYYGSCYGMVCTDLVRAAYDTSGCYLPPEADTRTVNVMYEAFTQNPLLRYYENGNNNFSLEPGDVVFFGKLDHTWFSHVGVVSEVKQNGFYMQNMNARRVYFIARIGYSGNLYDSPFYDDRHILLGWGRAAQ